MIKKLKTFRQKVKQLPKPQYYSVHYKGKPYNNNTFPTCLELLEKIYKSLITDKQLIEEELCVDFLFNFYNDYYNFITKPQYTYQLKVLISDISSNNIPNLIFSDYLLDKYRGTDRCLNKERSMRYNEWLSKANNETSS